MRTVIYVCEVVNLFFSIFTTLARIVTKMSIIRKESVTMENTEALKKALTDLDDYLETLKEKIKKSCFKELKK